MLVLGNLIRFLAAADQDYIAPIGIGEPMSYRGYYSEVAFAPTANISVREMLENARSALGATFKGYKGGEYTMTEHSDCYLAHYGQTGDGIGPILLGYMTGRYVPPV